MSVKMELHFATYRCNVIQTHEIVSFHWGQIQIIAFSCSSLLVMMQRATFSNDAMACSSMWVPQVPGLVVSERYASKVMDDSTKLIIWLPSGTR